MKLNYDMNLEIISEKIIMKIVLFSFLVAGNVALFAGPDNIALQAKASASAEWNDNFAAAKINDGLIGISEIGEWASDSKENFWGGINYPWIQLDWDENQFIDKIIFYDRVSLKSHLAGGTLLFSVGPNGQGQIPEIGAQFLRDAGTWIQKYPQVVYAAGASPWGHAMPWGDVTTKGKSMFLSVFDWPQDGKLYLPGLKNEILSAHLLKGAKAEKISFEQKQGWTIFNVPFQPGDTPASVIELTFDSAPSTEDVESGQLRLCPLRV